MATLAAALDSIFTPPHSGLTRGENGEPIYTADGLGSALLGLANECVRGVEGTVLSKLADQVVAEAERDGRSPAVELFVLAAHVRDVRAGRGEKKVFEELVSHVLLPRWPAIVSDALLPLLPTYGSWMDIVKIANEHEDACGDKALELFATQIEKDCAVLRNAGIDCMSANSVDDAVVLATQDKLNLSISLAGKWAPRERRSTGRRSFAKKLARRLALSDTVNAPATTPSAVHQRYRRKVATLSAVLDIPERKMCSGQWAGIEPAANPARCTMTNRAAFANVIARGSEKGEIRHPDNADRVQCAANFAKAAKDKKLKGAGSLHPHEITTKLFQESNTSSVAAMLEAQWAAVRAGVAESGALGNMCALVDVSGSMSGTPLEVAVALGTLISELSVTFKDRVMTFESEPHWVDLSGCETVRDRVFKIRRAGWGTTTNFEKAMDLILEVCVSAKVPSEEVAQISLVVLSDMQFNQVSKKNAFSWETAVERIEREFAEAGYPTHPHIVFWNLRATGTAAATAYRRGVTMLAGFSPAYFKYFVEGNISAITPLETLKLALQGERYAPLVAAVEAAAGADGYDEINTTDGTIALAD